MNVSIHFTIDIDPEEWEGRKTGSPVPVDTEDSDTVMRIATEVRRHAEEVVRGLYTDMGWALGDEEVAV